MNYVLNNRKEAHGGGTEQLKRKQCWERFQFVRPHEIDSVQMDFTIQVLSLIPVLIILKSWCLHPDCCILFSQAPVISLYREKKCGSFFKGEKNETAAAYCGISAIKCHHRYCIRLISSSGRRERRQITENRRPLTCLPLDLNKSAYRCFLPSKLPITLNV